VLGGGSTLAGLLHAVNAARRPKKLKTRIKLQKRLTKTLCVFVLGVCFANSRLAVPNGERRTENGERRTENGERRTENGEPLFIVA
jgi:hypothetical protein